MPKHTPLQERPPKRPYVLINMAMSADGKIAAAASQFSRIGSKKDEDHLFRLRSSVDGIVSGATTIRQERATLSVRTGKQKKRPTKSAPFRILASAHGSLPLTAPLFTTPGGPVLVLTSNQIPPTQLKQYQAKAEGIHQSKGKTIDWISALAWLRTEWNIRRLLCEGGGQLNQSLLKAHLVDELNLTICPIIMAGSEATSIAEGTAFPSLEKCSQWKLKTHKQINQESFLCFVREDPLTLT